MGAGGNTKLTLTLTKPTSLEAESDAADYRAPNLLMRLLSLFKDVRPGSDLSHFQVPPEFNMPKSQLQCYGESVYCFRQNMLSKCNNGATPVDRFIAVVAWNLSILRPLTFGISPFNPILGETHHVSNGTLNTLVEQVSHHPPVTALHATDEKEALEILWCHYPSAKFHGVRVEVDVRGKKQLKLLNHGETYVSNASKLTFKFLPVPATEWGGVVRIECRESDLEAELHFKGVSFLGRQHNARSVKGKISIASSSKPLYEISGQWDRTVTVKDMKSGDVRVIYNAEEVIMGLETPQVQDQMGVQASESAVVWSEVSQGILRQDWEKAKSAKKAVEEKQRKLAKERESRGETWNPQHFTVSRTKQDDCEWECLPIKNSVPPAPVVVPV